MTHNCRVCDVELTDDNWYPSCEKGGSCICKECHMEQNKTWDKENPEKSKATKIRCERKSGHLPMSENKECASYFGVHTLERVLKNSFDDVERMPYGNKGYDFICSKGKKVDAKGACKTKNRNGWAFGIRKNTIAEYFCLVAFDNRKDLNPLYMWMIPGHVLNHLTVASISPSTLSKWDKYRKPIGKLSICCDDMRGNNGD